jgi:hypothetical protein
MRGRFSGGGNKHGMAAYPLAVNFNMLYFVLLTDAVTSVWFVEASGGHLTNIGLRDENWSSKPLGAGAENAVHNASTCWALTSLAHLSLV